MLGGFCWWYFGWFGYCGVGNLVYCWDFAVVAGLGGVLVAICLVVAFVVLTLIDFADRVFVLDLACAVRVGGCLQFGCWFGFLGFELLVCRRVVGCFVGCWSLVGWLVYWLVLVGLIVASLGFGWVVYECWCGFCRFVCGCYGCMCCGGLVVEIVAAQFRALGVLRWVFYGSLGLVVFYVL